MTVSTVGENNRKASGQNLLYFLRLFSSSPSRRTLLLLLLLLHDLYRVNFENRVRGAAFRCFSHAGPKAWNALPAELQDLMDHSAFKRQLKTFLFERAFTT